MQVSANERRSGKFEDGRLELAIREFQSNGFLILRDCLPGALTTELREAYIAALEKKIRRSGIRPFEEPDPRQDSNEGVSIDFTPRGGNHDLNRWNMHLPSCMPFMDSSVIANPLALEVIKALLGDRCILSVIASDTAFPKSGYQSLHQDAGFFRITVNIPLIDFTEINGATELWPGSHQPATSTSEIFDKGFHKLSDAELKRLLDTEEPTKLTVPAGSLVIRDQRLVHRGAPNRSDEARPMLSLIYYIPPPELPYLFVSNLFSALSAGMRRLAWRLNGMRYGEKLLLWGNTMGRKIEMFGGTDRDYRRRLPAQIWDSLSPSAKHLLRFASIDGNAKSIRPELPRTAGASLRFAVNRIFNKNLRKQTPLRQSD